MMIEMQCELAELSIFAIYFLVCITWMHLEVHEKCGVVGS